MNKRMEILVNIFGKIIRIKYNGFAVIATKYVDCLEYPVYSFEKKELLDFSILKEIDKIVKK